MTPPAFVVLMLAIVCSTHGKAGEQTADRASKHAMHIERETSNLLTNEMRPWTNIHSYVVNNLDEINKNNKETRTNNFHIQDSHVKHKNLKIDNPFIEGNVKNYNTRSKIFFKKLPKITESTKKIIDEEVKNGNKEFNEVHSRSIRKDHVNFNAKNHMNTFSDKEPSETFYIDANFKHFDQKRMNDMYINRQSSSRTLNSIKKRVKREITKDPRCEPFSKQNKPNTLIYHPHNETIKNANYYSNIECTLELEAKQGQVIKLTFIDKFHIEYHSKCAYDYLEVRDGKHGYSQLSGRFCGEVFPQELTSTGPYMWLKFKSDETIEYEGFTIKVDYYTSQTSYAVPTECYVELSGHSGHVASADISKDCKQNTGPHALDVLWTINTASGTDIYLNNTDFKLAFPNDCVENVVQIFGEVLEDDAKLAHYCGSTANAVSTKEDNKKTESGNNKMHVRMYLSQRAIANTKVNLTYTAFRTLDPEKESDCNEDEFNCEDNTCINKGLRCDNYAHCRLKADEDPEECKSVQESLADKPHILIILVIFSLILSGMSFIFLFKCMRKLYQDHKAIKEHIRQSTEDHLDTITSSGLLLNPKNLRDQPRASLERDNHTNELYKQQRSISQHKRLPQQTSIDSDFHETQLDLDEEPWRREVESIPEHQDAKAERNGKTRRSDTSRKEESLRSRKESVEKKEIRDAAVGVPDTKEEGCQTRESLFQTDPAPSSDGSNSASNSRGFSTFGYSGATLVRPSPPPATTPAPAPAISSVQIELLRQIPSFESTHKTLKKLPDRRPMSAETTRSAPDVIIVSKPIR